MWSIVPAMVTSMKCGGANANFGITGTSYALHYFSLSIPLSACGLVCRVRSGTAMRDRRVMSSSWAYARITLNERDVARVVEMLRGNEVLIEDDLGSDRPRRPALSAFIYRARRLPDDCR